MNPTSLFSSRGGALLVGGVPVGAIVKTTGTPVYIYDTSIMRRQYETLADALPREFAIHYSVKANPNLAVARVFKALGAGAEVASKAELALALAAGFAAGDILFAGPGKSDDEIAAAVESGIGSLNIESETELARVRAAARRAFLKRKSRTRVAFRVNVDAGGAKQFMIGGAQKFGVDAEQLEPLVRRALGDPHLEVAGFHFYPGTGFLDPSALAAAYRAYARFIKAFSRRLDIKVKTVNFGGGLGVPYNDGERELDVKAVGNALRGVTADLKRSPLFAATRFVLEPGRYLAGPAGVYVSSVTDVKTSRDRRFVITDGGIHHALIPIAFNKNHPTALVNKMNRRKTAACTIAGPLCASIDQFSRDVKLPKPHIGDLVGLFNAGAYGYTASMLSFLSHPTPPEVLVEEGKVFLIRERRAPEHGVRKRLRVSGAAARRG